MILEFCAENFTHIQTAIHRGAGRIELCDNLAVGGTTPSFGVIKAVIATAHMHKVPVMTMIRCRGGDFEYSTSEKQIMLADAQLASQLGADGLVFGALNGSTLDTPFAEEMAHIAQANGQQLTFHMAFDELDVDEQARAIDNLAKLGIERILTHGGPAGSDILSNIQHLQDLQNYAGERLRILPGGGIHTGNLHIVHQALQFPEYHGTRIV
ncbi:copper homeostasis protein CutC [Suicoccus acidiformans]|uniref:PF03932 family protein CutC n=1 Tax=Suicoccus acidiformans TaxID=2036206 RepID=A0A347WMS9_9LACT|nr:copper homeostasis protein CutC [Suicoccus acidiformans]AXY26386.1 copper homeostasis protein CutC [Suicoccus acidiformans]